MKQLPVVHQHLHRHTQFDRHRPRLAPVDLLGHAVIHRTDQRQRGLPAATALAFDSVLAATAGVVVSGMDELVAQGAAALESGQPFVDDDEAERIVVESAPVSGQPAFLHAHAQCFRPGRQCGVVHCLAVFTTVVVPIAVVSQLTPSALV